MKLFPGVGPDDGGALCAATPSRDTPSNSLFGHTTPVCHPLPHSCTTPSSSPISPSSSLLPILHQSSSLRSTSRRWCAHTWASLVSPATWRSNASAHSQEARSPEWPSPSARGASRTCWCWTSRWVHVLACPALKSFVCSPATFAHRDLRLGRAGVCDLRLGMVRLLLPSANVTSLFSRVFHALQTNHLDIETIDALIVALGSFQVRVTVSVVGDCLGRIHLSPSTPLRASATSIASTSLH